MITPNVDFPLPLLNYFQEVQQNVYSGLINLFKESESIREAFLVWAIQHRKIVEDAPFLCEAKRIATALNLIKTAQSIDNLTTLPYRSNQVESMNMTQSEAKFVKNFSHSNVLAAIVLFNMQIIDKESFITLFNEKAFGEDQRSELIETLSKVKYSRGVSLLCCEDMVEASLPFLKSITNDLLCECFSTQDDDGNPPLFYTGVLKKMLPLLSKRECFIKLLELQNHAGETVLHKTDLLNSLLPFLQGLYFKSDSQIVITLLSRKDNNGNTPLHSQENVELAIPLLRLLNSEDLQHLIDIDNPNGDIPRNHLYTLNQTSLLDKLFITKPIDLASRPYHY